MTLSNRYRFSAVLSVMLAFSLALAAPAEDTLPQLAKLIEAGQTDQARELIRQSPEEARRALGQLITEFDGSVHSHRDKPEQRRVQYSQSLLEAGLKLSSMLQELAGDGSYLRRFEARRDRMQATQLLNQKRYQQAMDLVQQVRKTALEQEDKSFLFSTYLTSAYANLGLGRGDLALQDCETALKLARETGDPSKNALALFNLGTAYMHLNRVVESLPFSRQAAEASAKVGNKLWEANAWLNVGSAELMAHNYEASEDALNRTLKLSKEVGDKLAEGRAYFDLGVLYHSWERWESATVNLEESLRFIRGVDIRHSHDISDYNHVEKEALQLLVGSYEKLNRTDAAVIEAKNRLEAMKQLAPQAAEPHGHTH
jgi:tetratricopeptide (TPR) repeat protein